MQLHDMQLLVYKVLDLESRMISASAPNAHLYTNGISTETFCSIQMFGPCLCGYTHFKRSHKGTDYRIEQNAIIWALLLTLIVGAPSTAECYPLASTINHLRANRTLLLNLHRKHSFKIIKSGHINHQLTANKSNTRFVTTIMRYTNI